MFLVLLQLTCTWVAFRYTHVNKSYKVFLLTLLASCGKRSAFPCPRFAFVLGTELLEPLLLWHLFAWKGSALWWTSSISKCKFTHCFQRLLCRISCPWYPWPLFSVKSQRTWLFDLVTRQEDCWMPHLGMSQSWSCPLQPWLKDSMWLLPCLLLDLCCPICFWS